MSYIGRLGAFCVLCPLLLPGVAHGQAGGQPDPDSPAGVEYELPLEQARKKASRGGGDSGGSRRDRAGQKRQVPLFGAGIVATQRRHDPGRRASQRDQASEDGRRGPGTGGGEGRAEGAGRARSEAGQGSDASAGPTVSRSAVAGSDDEGGSAGLWTAGIALMVLLAGGLLGLVLRRTLRQSSD